MKKKPQAKQQGKPVKAGLNFSEKKRLAELKRTLAGNDKKQEKEAKQKAKKKGR